MFYPYYLSDNLDIDEINIDVDVLNDSGLLNAMEREDYTEKQKQIEKANELSIADKNSIEIQDNMYIKDDKFHKQTKKNKRPLKPIILEDTTKRRLCGSRNVKSQQCRNENSKEDDESYSVNDTSYGSNFLDEVTNHEEDSDNGETNFEITKNTRNVSTTDLKTGSFVLVKFILEKRTKFYIGEVIEVRGKKGYKIKFLRHKGEGKFAWPINDDISFIYKCDIESIIDNPISEKRGMKIFKISQFNFKID